MGLITYGKVTKRHGLSGELKVLPYSGSLDNFKNFKHIYIDLSSEEEPQKYLISKVRIHKNTAIVKLQGIDTPEQADKLKNANILIDEKDLGELDENEFYWYQLIGLKVFNVSDKYIGTVDNLLNNTAQDILVIKNEIEDKEYLIPFVEQFILDINFEESKIIINPAEGLLD
ncbi:MAG: 16S rRNA processing protein RimM [Candidatus Dadabacteria bacterium]|nr:16S rRNA processing protein RimM [Candidatus Dadabacteria bacterium]NIQ14071.1 16S rRNA processing protein RimM [Candidatus Dadabacteria bacterium]